MKVILEENEKELLVDFVLVGFLGISITIVAVFSLALAIGLLTFGCFSMLLAISYKIKQLTNKLKRRRKVGKRGK